MIATETPMCIISVKIVTHIFAAETFTCVNAAETSNCIIATVTYIVAYVSCIIPKEKLSPAELTSETFTYRDGASQR